MLLLALLLPVRLQHFMQVCCELYHDPTLVYFAGSAASYSRDANRREEQAADHSAQESEDAARWKTGPAGIAADSSAHHAPLLACS